MENALSFANITFDGLMRFALDRETKLCRIELHTKAKGHIMKIRVNQGGTLFEREILSQERLLELGAIRIFVQDENGPIPFSTADQGSYYKILDLGSENFYNSPRPTKPDCYGCSIWLQNGLIGSGDEEICDRVKKELFGALKFTWQCRNEWDGFKLAAQHLDKDSIKSLAPFARNVKAEVPLAAGQSLCITGPKTDDVIIGPLIAGPGYDIRIEYVDIDPPDNLADCEGFAHHCEALELGESDSIYGIFRPARYLDEVNDLNVITDSGCCLGCRNGSSANLSAEAQEFSVSSAAPRRAPARRTVKKR